MNIQQKEVAEESSEFRIKVLSQTVQNNTRGKVYKQTIWNIIEI